MGLDDCQVGTLGLVHGVVRSTAADLNDNFYVSRELIESSRLWEKLN